RKAITGSIWTSPFHAEYLARGDAKIAAVCATRCRHAPQEGPCVSVFFRVRRPGSLRGGLDTRGHACGDRQAPRRGSCEDGGAERLDRNRERREDPVRYLFRVAATRAARRLPNAGDALN